MLKESRLITKQIILIVLLTPLLALAASDPSSLAAEIGLDIKVRFNDALCECNKMPDFKTEKAFSELVRLGKVNLIFHECIDKKACNQIYRVIFQNKLELYSFVASLDPAPEYPFYNGADYNLYSKLIKLAVETGDDSLYWAFMKKNTGLSASELNAPLYSNLRKNPEAFLKVYAEMDSTERSILVGTQYDFNESSEWHRFSDEIISRLPNIILKKAAKEYNAYFNDEK